MLRLLLAALVLIAAPVASLSQDAGPAGTYRRSGPYDQTFKVRAGREPGSFFGSFSVATRGCTGSVDAPGRATGLQEVVFTERDDGGSLCRITMRFGPGFRTVAVSEDDCLYWHGASCDFEGKLKRVGR